MEERVAIEHHPEFTVATLDETKVVCGIVAQVAEPRPEQPQHGYIDVQFRYTAMCSGRDPLTDKLHSKAMSELLVSILAIKQGSERHFIDTEQLCIEKGKACWALFITLDCLNDNGNGFDCGVAALFSHLGGYSLPQAVLGDGGVHVDASVQRKIVLRHTASAHTQALPQRETRPWRVEDDLFSSRVVVVRDCFRNIVYLSRSGAPTAKIGLAQHIRV
ncbi:MAG: exosome complex component RRP43-like [Amphiamblys sp. WSBS2006]|nr:MAG: exosome complex component RRP43-like [Amphiamblys sp. WSBS2006]